MNQHQFNSHHFPLTKFCDDDTLINTSLVYSQHVWRQTNLANQNGWGYGTSLISKWSTNIHLYLTRGFLDRSNITTKYSHGLGLWIVAREIPNIIDTSDIIVARWWNTGLVSKCQYSLSSFMLQDKSNGVHFEFLLPKTSTMRK